jgi:uncharacterized damage-inducible protein DinB
MAFDAPTDPIATPNERELLLRFLQTQRELVAWSAVDLTEDQARWQPDGKLIPIIGVINHLTHVEWRWIDGSYARAEAVWRSEDEFTVGPERTLAEVVDAYAARAAATDRTVREAPGLDASCIRPEAHPEVDLRWVLLHLIEETAHHAGHADATRELLDGRQSGW